MKREQPITEILFMMALVGKPLTFEGKRYLFQIWKDKLETYTIETPSGVLISKLRPKFSKETLDDFINRKLREEDYQNLLLSQVKSR